MKSKQVLSIEQMKHLQELGLDTSDASMYWVRRSHGSRIDDESKGEWFLSLQKEFMVCGFLSYEILPAFTLQDIINLLPTSINWKPLIIVGNSIMYSAGYGEGYHHPMKIFKEESLLESAYIMLCWVIKEGYLRLNKEE